MNQSTELIEQAAQIAEQTETSPGERLSRLSEAILKLHANLDLETLPNVIMESVRSLLGSDYAALGLYDPSEALEELYSSGLTPDEHEALRALDMHRQSYTPVPGLRTPMRVGEIESNPTPLDWLNLPMPISAIFAFPLRDGDTPMAVLHATKATGGYSLEDEELMRLFTDQAALALANARRQAEQAHAQIDTSDLLEALPVGVIILDAKTGATPWLNRGARHILAKVNQPGRPTEKLFDELMQRGTIRRGDGREQALNEISLPRVLRNTNILRTRAEEIVLKLPNGQSVTTILNVAPIRSAEGEVESVVVTFQDMQPIEEVTRRFGEFATFAADALRLPATSIKGAAAALLDKRDDFRADEMRQFLRIINDQAEHLQRLIQDLLEQVQAQSGTLSLNRETVDVALLLSETRNAFPGGRRIVLEFEPQLPPVLADRQRITRVLHDLLTIAVLHSPANTPILLRAAINDAHVAITVTNRGEGIAPGRLRQVFRKLDFSNNDEQPGSLATDLDLSVCRGIVEAHDGRIWVESEGPGRGSHFSFTLPFAAAQPPAADPTARASVLLVDRDPESLRILHQQLAQAQYAPIASEDPADVLNLIERHRPQAAILDLMLPEIDQDELISKITGRLKVPVLLLSRPGQDERIARALQQGAADYLNKPISPTELITRLQIVLNRQETSSTIPAAPAAPAPEAEPPFQLGQLRIDYVQRAVTVAGKTVQLTATEYAVLRELSLHAGETISYERLLSRVWHRRRFDDTRPVRSLVRRLRRKLNDDADRPSYVFTEPGLGYRMPEPESRTHVPPPPPPHPNPPLINLLAAASDDQVL